MFKGQEIKITYDCKHRKGVYLFFFSLRIRSTRKFQNIWRDECVKHDAAKLPQDLAGGCGAATKGVVLPPHPHHFSWQKNGRRQGWDGPELQNMGTSWPDSQPSCGCRDDAPHSDRGAWVRSRGGWRGFLTPLHRLQHQELLAGGWAIHLQLISLLDS